MTTFKNKLLMFVLLSIVPSGLVTEAIGDYDTTTDIRFRELPGVEPTQQSLDYFLPIVEDGEEAPSNLPVILYVHGGRWNAGDKNIDQTPIPGFFIDQGFVVVSTNYRLTTEESNQHPAQVEDIADAVGWISDNIRYRSGNPRAIYLVGHGAGAHLVALLATDHSRLIDVGVRPVDVKGVVLLDPLILDVVEIMQSPDSRKAYHQAAFGENLEVWQDASPTHHIRPDFPIVPHLIVAGCPVGWPSVEHLGKLKEDRWSAIENYTKKLREHNVRVDLVNAMQYQSFFAVDQHFGTAGDQTTQIVADFLQELESLRIQREPVPSEGVVHTLTVEGDDWRAAAHELGNVTFTMWNYDKLLDVDTPIKRSDFPEALLSDFDSWDSNNDKSLDRTETQAAFEALHSD